jgi:urea carboxylase
MCIYGMDSPGGYQLVGRTLPIWNKFLTNPVFIGGKPWLLRFFDQVRFYPVDEPELDRLRDAFRAGRATIEVSEEVFDLGEYNRFLKSIEPELVEFKSRQKAAFDTEVAHWKTEDDAARAAAEAAAEIEVAVIDDGAAADGHTVAADISGSVWKLLVDAGALVAEGDPMLIVEAMKMEFAVHSPVAGRVRSLRCKQGSVVAAGDALAVIEVA